MSRDNVPTPDPSAIDADFPLLQELAISSEVKLVLTYYGEGPKSGNAANRNGSKVERRVRGHIRYWIPDPEAHKPESNIDPGKGYRVG